MGRKIFNKRVKAIISCIVLSGFVLIGCGQKNNSANENSELPIATIKVKDYGTITAELYPNKAPETVKNFISLANEGFYNNLTFHRVIKDFMIQGGCPLGTGTGGPDYSIKGEFSANGFENDLAHTEGIISMARSQNPNSAGSQFFIVTKDSPHLDGNYAAFAKVIEGMDVAHKIENTKTGNNDKPTKEVKIEEIKVDTKGVKYEKPEKINER
ncbi:peptidylprolyl isomerase [Clostridium tarantellae]|uniref:Peptidyl-prolyl cis-trans isomerase n=1 Tax=Clostridium tarantellae TaxID=39493 RepID=A0A6I1MN38_9CLOT|nr:peptidylprolyl isomerase [Clostridium tarantellae]MPQ44906.1 peptidylprolyl isomerase [Clostridium tarantellae]